MFKLVVLSAILAAVAANPSAGIAAFGYSPLAFASNYAYSPLLSPATTSISQQASSVVHPSPLTYSYYPSAAHFIKKRSAPAFVAPTTYIAPAAGFPLTYTTPLNYPYSAPALFPGSPIYPAAHFPYTAAHLIKKRSAQVFVQPTYAAAAPLLTSSYTATPLIHSTPIIHSTPLVHPASLISTPIITPHLIKKRSAQIVTPYLAPASYSHQSRVDYTHSSPFISTTTYTSPITYSSPITFPYAHVL